MNSKKGLISLILITVFSGSMAACTFTPEDLNSNITGEIVQPGYETEHFRVTYYNYDDSFLWSNYTQANTRAEYKGPHPTKEADDEFTYAFDRWEAKDGIPYGDPVTKDCSYRAVYVSTPVERYTCYFYNYDGTYLYETLVKAGESAIYLGPTPTRPDEGEVKYTFIGWDKSTRDIHSQTSFIATYSSANPTFVVKFLNYDGTLLDIKQVPYGDTVAYDGPTPSKPSENDKSYRFVRWDKPLENITEDTEIHALFESDARLVTVRYLNADGTVLQSSNIPYGNIPTYSGKTPTKESEGRIGYVFDKWSISGEPAYINTDIVAIFKEVERNYTTGLSFSYDDANQSYTVMDYHGSANEVYIPLTYTGGNGERAVTKIGNYAFERSEITKIIIGDNISEIGDYAFRDCSRLKQIEFSKNLRKIGAYAFENCSALESLEFPKYVNDVVRETFKGFNLEILRFSSDNKFFTLYDGFLLNGTRTTIYFPIGENYYNELVIPDGVINVAARAFKNGSINKVVFPSSIERVGTEAFANISTLKEVVFQDSECVIEASVFEGCAALQSIDLGSNIDTVKTKAFMGTNISSLTISKECVAFDLTALRDCNKLAEVSVQDGNKKFSSYDGALYLKGFSSLIYLPPAKRGTLKLNKALIDLSDDTFKDCSIESFEVDEENTVFASYKGVVYSKDLKELVLVPKLLSNFEAPNTLETLAINAFAHCTEILTIDLSNTVIKEIGESAFEGCGNLRNVTLPDGLEKIGYRAFKSCGSLKNITLTENIKRIGHEAFAYCGSLNTITIPNSVEKIDSSAFCYSGVATLTLGTGLLDIGEFAFAQCSNLGSVIIPNSVTSLGNSAFASCPALKSVTIGSDCSTIGGYCFVNCNSLKSLAISSTSLSDVGSYLFSGCYNLTDVDLGSGFTRISEGMFQSCTALKSISVPNNVTEIGEGAFRDCSKLDTINIGNSLISLDNAAFANCVSLEAISLGDSFMNFNTSSFEGCTNLKSLNLGNSIKSLPNNAFSSMTSLTSLIIPDTVTSIGTGLFQNNSGIESVSLGKGITTLPENTFSNCTNLKTIDFSSAISISSIGDYAFNKCSSLETITIPNSVLTIGTYAFSYCYGLKSINLSDNLTQLSDGLFYNCTALESFVVPKNVTSFDSGSFYGCSGMKTFDFGDNIEFIQQNSLNNFTNLETVIFPKNLTSVPNYICRNLSKLKNITLPENLESFSYNMFSGCTSLESITIPDSVRYIYGNAFSNCTNLKTVIFGTGLTSIEYDAFSNCTALESIALPDSITNLSSSIFYYCTSLKEVTLPKNLNYIQNGMFYNCTSLESITLPTNCNYIYDSAFYNCTSLTTVENVSNVTEIYSSVFYNCSALANLELGSSLRRVGSNAFYNCTSLPTIAYKNGNYLKVGSNEHYILCSVINKNVESFEFASDMKIIMGQAFADSTIKAISIPSEMTEIPAYMFSNMNSLEEITIPNTITRINEYAFYYCRNLETVYIPDSVTYLSDYVFYECASLTSIRLPKNLDYIRNGVFYGCKNLEEISIPDNVQGIYSDSFSQSGLKTINIPKKCTYVSESAFRYMPNGFTITVDESNSSYRVINGSLYDYSGANLIKYCFKGNEKYIILGKTVSSIYAYAFDYNQEFNAIYFEGSVNECDVRLNWGWVDSSYYDSASWYYYSSTYSLGCWHYVNGVPTLYE